MAHWCPLVQMIPLSQESLFLILMFNHNHQKQQEAKQRENEVRKNLGLLVEEAVLDLSLTWCPRAQLLSVKQILFIELSTLSTSRRQKDPFYQIVKFPVFRCKALLSL